jgi:PBP1b-binding outer membrane lipoprotein LpoB
MFFKENHKKKQHTLSQTASSKQYDYLIHATIYNLRYSSKSRFVGYDTNLMLGMTLT